MTEEIKGQGVEPAKIDRSKLPPPGAFYDENAKVISFSEQKEEFAEEQAGRRRQKETLIKDALSQGEIKPQFARLLENTHSSTLGSEDANLHKVKIALQLKDKLPKEMFGEKKVAYIASGTDWQFPVALGARNIDMVDPELTKERAQKMLNDIQQFDAQAAIEDSHLIAFHIDVGNGLEKVLINLVSQKGGEYSPDSSLGGIIEILGINRGAKYPIMLPNVAKHLLEGAIIANFDFAGKFDIENSGLEQLSFGDVNLYKVIDQQKTLQSSGTDSFKPKDPDLKVLQKISRDKKVIDLSEQNIRPTPDSWLKISPPNFNKEKPPSETSVVFPTPLYNDLSSQ